ncbi:MAG TPA: reductase, partial [Planctomycetota bacterium]|nr:reductase [Planctomycetota bacterium]
MPLHEYLRRKADLRAIPDRLLDALRDRASGGSRDRISAMISGEDDWALEHDILDLLDEFPHARPPAVEIAEHLDAIRPRLYSIASSPRAQGREVHLTIAVVRYEKNGRAHKGVASTYLAERARSGARVPVHIHPAPHFRLPPDDVPIIMVGPGTGVAPFRAFLHERKARGASGRNWLFFGERRCDTDFLFRDELRTFLDEGILTRLSTAFSRDQAQKVYVQDRLREHKADVWSWLEEGACLYVCGDASRMAVDVERSLVSIAEEMRGWSRERAREWLRELASAGRYAKDVY